MVKFLPVYFARMLFLWQSAGCPFRVFWTSSARGLWKFGASPFALRRREYVMDTTASALDVALYHASLYRGYFCSVGAFKSDYAVVVCVGLDVDCGVFVSVVVYYVVKNKVLTLRVHFILFLLRFCEACFVLQLSGGEHFQLSFRRRDDS